MTVDEIKARIREVESAQQAALSGKSYSIDGVSYTRQDMSVLDDMHAKLCARLRMLLTRNASSISLRPAICIDRGCGWRKQ